VEGLRDRDGDVAAATSPSDSSLATLVDEHSAAVYRLARSIVRDPGLADDVTQETFIKVWKHHDSFRGEGAIRGWILRIAHREAIATLRRSRDAVTDPDHLASATDSMSVSATGNMSVSRVVEGRLAYAGFQEALDELDELSRAVLVLREVEGMSYDEISTTVGVPVSTVKIRLLRARRRMSVRLEGWRG
jgi:RNA polymerase sigma-70 factor (ECF subfamily)